MSSDVWTMTAVIFALSIFASGQGLELTLDRDDPVPKPQVRAPCGVLTCQETVTSPATDSHQGTNDNETESFSFSAILSMEVFKADRSKRDRAVLLGSISTGHPRVTTVADGVELNGSLEAGLCSMRAHLFKKDDCLSVFTCKVHGLDANGNKLTSASKLEPREEHKGEDKLQAGSLAPDMTSQLFSLVQQLEIKLTLATQSMKCREDKLNSLQIYLGDKLVTSERRLRDKLEQLRTEFQNSEERRRASSLERRIEDKLASFENTPDSNRALSSCNVPTYRMWNETLSSQNDLLKSFARLESKVNESYEQTQRTLKQQIESTMNDILSLKACKKGMKPSVAVSSYPYYVIQVSNVSDFDFPYLCDTLTDEGGWLVIQRRTTGDTDFYRGWEDYKRGFGSFDNDFWLGNDKIHAITSSGTFELRVELRFNSKVGYAHYNSFYVASEKAQYALELGDYRNSGDAGDSFSYHNGQAFTTWDRDNDSHDTINCAKHQNGGWWFNKCDNANLNGQWGAPNDKGLEWTAFAGSDSVSTSEMKIRRLY